MITPSFGLTATERVLPKLALDFTTAALDSRITFTRTTGASNPATYIGSNGYIANAANNQPRFDYNPITLVCKGLLIEESRTNVFTYSEAFNDVSWVAGGTSKSASSVTDPRGTTASIRFTATAGTGAKFVAKTVTVTAATAQAASFAVKAGTHNFIQIYNNGDAQAFVNFDLNAGVTGTAGTKTTGTITPLSNGWYICTALFNTSTAYSTGWRVYLAPSASATYGQSLAAAGTESVDFFFGQLEAGAFATSYIPTTTAALTRNADVATMTGTNFSSWFNASEGTFSTVNDHLGFSATDRFILMASTNPSGFAVNAITTRSYNTVQATTIFTGGVSQMSINSSGSLTANTTYNTAVAYKDNNSAVSRNASTASVDTSCTIPTVAALYIGGSGGSTNVMCGHVQKINYWPQRLTNAEIQAFSK